MILIFNRTVQKYLGADGLVTYTVIAYMNTIVINLMMGISQGAQPLVSYRYGKGDIRSCATLLRYALIAVVIIGVPTFVGLYIFAPGIVNAYLSEASAALVAKSIVAFRQYGVSWMLMGFNVAIGGYLTALERPQPAILISTGRGLIVQSLVLVAIAAVTNGAGLWFTPIFSEILVLGMAVLFLKRNMKQLQKI
jgi:Na+-driven multidrug efflux pump